MSKPHCRKCGRRRGCRCLRVNPKAPPLTGPGSGIVSYVRVSTTEQGLSGLGLEAQQTAVRAYARSVGRPIVQEFVDVVSGKKSGADRPELQKALTACRRTGSTLVIAKIDRLARNLAFVSALMDSGVEFVACDCPSANRLTIHILAAVAEAEGRAISERTRAALQAAKERGVLMGSHRPEHSGRLSPEAMEAGRRKAAQNRRRRAYRDSADVLTDLLNWRRSGLTWKQCADRLNNRDEPGSSNGKWRKGELWNMARRFGLFGHGTKQVN